MEDWRVKINVNVSEVEYRTRRGAKTKYVPTWMIHSYEEERLDDEVSVYDLNEKLEPYISQIKAPDWNLRVNSREFYQ